MEHTQKVVASGEVMVVANSPGQVMNSGLTVPPPQDVIRDEETVHPPQSVGREFVRQYYTMLHRASEQLHRFYSQDSSFLHERWDGSGIDDHPAIGQIEIYDRIKSMNFRDCHAKIFQVDSQLSILNTVVVQVLGQLSNNEEPMRKFMQTFVLVPQTNKKYYVHNDIFRYQDEGFDVSFTLHATEQEYNNGVDATPVEALYVQQVEEAAVQIIDSNPATLPKETTVEQKVVDEVENDVEERKEEEVKDDIFTTAADVVPQVTNEVAQEENEKNIVEKKPATTSTTATATTTTVESKEVVMPQKLSWAEMAGRNVGATFKSLPPKVEPRNGVAAAQANNNRSTPPPTTKTPPPGNASQQQAQRPANQSNREPQQQHQQNAVDDASSTSGRGMQYYPDQQQIFIGNLPHHMTDQDLKEFFEKYGKVLDIRINRKPNNSLPNFGFIAFDSAETVKHVLSLRPLYNGRFRVNVEEKKRREDLIGSRPRSGNPSGQSTANQNTDNSVANGNPGLNRDGATKTNVAETNQNDSA